MRPAKCMAEWEPVVLLWVERRADASKNARARLEKRCTGAPDPTTAPCNVHIPCYPVSQPHTRCRGYSSQADGEVRGAIHSESVIRRSRYGLYELEKHFLKRLEQGYDNVTADYSIYGTSSCSKFDTLALQSLVPTRHKGHETH